jgi:hypothetical protein
MNLPPFSQIRRTRRRGCFVQSAACAISFRHRSCPLPPFSPPLVIGPPFELEISWVQLSSTIVTLPLAQEIPLRFLAFVCLFVCAFIPGQRCMKVFSKHGILNIPLDLLLGEIPVSSRGSIPPGQPRGAPPPQSVPPNRVVPCPGYLLCRWSYGDPLCSFLRGASSSSIRFSVAFLSRCQVEQVAMNSQ